MNEEETVIYKKHKRYHEELLERRIKDMRLIANKYKNEVNFDEYGLKPLIMYVAQNGTVAEFHSLICYMEEVTVNKELYEISRLLKIYA